MEEVRRVYSELTQNPKSLNLEERSAGVAPEVNLRECVTRKPPPSSNKAAHSGFETRKRHHQKSKTGVSVTKRTHVFKFFF